MEKGEKIFLAGHQRMIGSAILRRLREDSFTNPKYIEMVREKFGSKVVEHIEQMLKHKIHRRFI